jgi:CRISPR-associated endonuclease/helicase Cas3
MSDRTYGRTRGGKPINDEMIEGLAEEAERGYEPGQLERHRRGPGRPPLGEAAKVVESVRLDPSLSAETAERAAAEGVTVSELIRRALRQYLQTAELSGSPARATPKGS